MAASDISDRHLNEWPADYSDQRHIQRNTRQTITVLFREATSICHGAGQTGQKTSSDGPAMRWKRCMKLPVDLQEGQTCRWLAGHAISDIIREARKTFAVFLPTRFPVSMRCIWPRSGMAGSTKSKRCLSHLYASNAPGQTAY